MGRIARLFRPSRKRGLYRDQSGVAAIEFALIGMGMFVMLSGAVDVTQAITIQRDLNRFTAEVAQAVAAACKGAASCAASAMDAVRLRQTNVAPKLGTMQLSMANFDKNNDRVENIIGTMTYLPADMNADAMAKLANGDKGVAVLATYTHQPIILSFASNWGFTTKNFRSARVVLAYRP
jgi:Flp pilus assembly protein TadG